MKNLKLSSKLIGGFGIMAALLLLGGCWVLRAWSL